MLVLLLSLLASTAGEAAARQARSVAPPHEGAPAQLVPVPAARHEDQAASRRVHVPVAAAAEGFVPSAVHSSCALYEPPSLAPLTPSATPSSQRDPPLTLA